MRENVNYLTIDFEFECLTYLLTLTKTTTYEDLHHAALKPKYVPR